MFGTPVTILSPDALKGIFKWKDTVTGEVRSQNLYQLAGSNYTNTPDPKLLDVLTKINQLSLAGGQVTDRVANSGDYNRLNLDFQAPAQNKREFLASHLDYNITSKHHFDAVYNFQYYDSRPDNVNSQFQSYPGTGTIFGNDALGSVHRNSFSLVGTLRSNLTNTIVNELRYGLSGGGTTQFGKEVTQDAFSALGGNALTFNFITAPQNRSSFSARNTPVWQLSENLYWTLNSAHSLSFGFQYTRVNSWQKIYGRQIIPLVSFAVNSNDPILAGTTTAQPAIFTANTLTNTTATNRCDAAALYALLTGRVGSISRSVSLDENTKNYAPTAFIERNRQQEFGLYASDAWRARPNLTVTYGLRWQVEPSPHNTNEVYAQNTIADVYGVSGVGNLFKPGTFSGAQPKYTPLASDVKAYKTQYGQFAPSLGLAYTVNRSGGNRLLDWVVGKDGQTVFRGGYSMAYVREGLNTFLLISGSNQGPTLSTTIDPTNTPSLFPAGSVLYRNPLPAQKPFPASQQASLLATPGVSVNAFDPNLKVGYVQSWTFGIQRELTKNMALEVRYVGNHGAKLWRQIELNQVDIFNNGFINEFKRAASNQAICVANATACLAAQATAGVAAGSRIATAYGNYGLAGQQNIPIIQTAAGSGFNTSFITWVQRGEAARTAQNIAFTGTRMASLINAGLVPSVTQADGTKVSNFFIANPSISNGGAYLVVNGTNTTYNALQIDLRRRLSAGLLVQANYTFSKSISNAYNSSSSVFSEPTDLRNPGFSKAISPWDLTHALKINWLYELPFGKGYRLGFNGGSFASKVGNTVFGNWQFNGVSRIQSGTPFLLVGGRETVTANDLQSASADNGVVLHGLTRKQLQDLVKINHVGNTVYYLPQDLALNSQAAFEAAGRNLSQLDPSKPYIGPPTTPGEFGERVILHGPGFTRFDLSLLKRLKLTETKEFQFRASFLNAFNNINFLATSPGNDTSTLSLTSTAPVFGTTTYAYRDSTVSGTNDPGGRLIEFQLRFNF